MQGIGELELYSGSQLKALDFSTIDGHPTPIELPVNIVKTPKGKASDYPLDTERSEESTREKALTMSSSSGPSLDWAHWYQLRWDPYIGWYWDDPDEMHALWQVDPNDPNDMIDAMTTCEPYVLWVDVNLPEPFDGNDAKSTVILRAVDDPNAVVSKIPMFMYLASKSLDNKVLTMASDFVVIVERPEDQGYYYDIWDNLYVAIYATQNSALDADFCKPFGDFNADDVVDYNDLSLFSDYWLTSANDVNTTYDAMYEEPNNWDGSINFNDFSAFAENWDPND